MTTKTPRLLSALCLVLYLAIAPVWADEDTAQGSTFELGLSTWISSGKTSWSHDASAINPNLGDPTSRLNYKDLESNIIELTGRANLPQGFYLDLAYGAGDINDGRLVDDDFLSAMGAAVFGTEVQGEHMFSRTVSEIDGNDIEFFNITLGREVFRAKNKKSWVKLFAGLQEWRENTLATGVTQTVCTSPGQLCSPEGSIRFVGVDAITNKVRWRSLFIGVDGVARVSNRLKFAGRLAYIAKADLDNRDIHHLRADLDQGTSFRMTGTGSGFNLDLTAILQLSRYLDAHAGVRYWRLEVNNEANGWSVHPVAGPPTVAKLNEFKSERTGVVLGLTYTPGRRKN